jgi:hypothetical protein
MAENDIPAISVPNLVPQLFPDEDIAADTLLKIFDEKVTRHAAYYLVRFADQPLHAACWIPGADLPL